MRRDQLPPHKTATFVLPRWKVVYVSVPKAACTSIKWMIARVQEEDAERFYTSLSREIARPTTIHRRRLWQHTPMLHRLPDDELAQVSPENGWFVFAVVRHPTTRLWSAWQSKFLLQEPNFATRFGDAPWFPRIPSTTQDVVEDFQQFVRSLAEAPGQPCLRDRHFLPQSRLLTPERTPYTRIYQTAQIPELLDELGTHLRGQGWQGSLELVRSNETPLRPVASMFTPDIDAAIAETYAEDFERFGYESVEPDKLEPTEEYAESTLLEIGRLVERAERISDLALRAQRLAGANRAKQQEIRMLKHGGAKRSAASSGGNGRAGKVRQTIAKVVYRVTWPSGRTAPPLR
jgi:Sulfotransferase family